MGTRVYISGPLQGVRDLASMRRFYESVADACVECGHEPYLPHQNTDPEQHSHLPSKKVFLQDYDALRSADIVLAYVGMPSSGVGAELGIAAETGKKIIGFCKDSDTPSRFILGLLEAWPDASLIRYRDTTDCLQLIRSALSKASHQS